jgi:hypothetical protein
MAMRLRGVARVCCLMGKVVLMVVLVNWVAAVPLVWILRDGLAPGMVESVGTQAAFTFLVCRGVPALVLAVPLFGLSVIERRLTPP